jgi:hypothetical protein
MGGTGSGSCPMAGFGISGAEPSSSTTSKLVLFRGLPLVESCQP